MSSRITEFLRAGGRRILVIKPHLRAIGFVALLCAPHVIEMPGGHPVIGSVASDLARILGFALQQGLVGRVSRSIRSTQVREWLAKRSGARTMGQETATGRQDAVDRAGR